MNKIASFCINHDILNLRLYLTRIDGDVITCDLRMIKPNNDDCLDQAGLHTLEHLFATSFQEVIPGASPNSEYVNYLEHDLNKARLYAQGYKTITAVDFNYSQEVKA